MSSIGPFVFCTLAVGLAEFYTILTFVSTNVQ